MLRRLRHQLAGLGSRRRTDRRGRGRRGAAGDERTDDTTQVTYNGHLLYYFAGDEAPGDTNGQNVGDVWFVVSPEGEALTAAPKTDGDRDY